MSRIDAPSAVAAPAATGGWLAHVWRLTRWYLFAVRRRAMSKVLLGVLLGGFVLVFAFQLFLYLAFSSPDGSSQVSCPPTPVSTTQTVTGQPEQGGLPECDPQQAQQIEQERQNAIDTQRVGLTFPNSLSLAGGYTGFMGLLLLCGLVGALVGGEYGMGTVRHPLSRGMSRGQFLAAQVMASAILALLVALLMQALGALAGFLIGPALGGKIPSIPPGGLLEIGGYWLSVALQLFAFSLIALFLGTLTRSTVAAVIVTLVYIFVEDIAAPVLVALGGLENDVARAFSRVPEWLLGPNASAPAVNVAQGPLDLGVSTSSALVKLSTVHALIVTGVYCVLLIGFSYLVLRRRDITD
jgi:ABC-type transport system involved in multi-copper enzyme maturation permease subunit